MSSLFATPDENAPAPLPLPPPVVGSASPDAAFDAARGGELLELPERGTGAGVPLHAAPLRGAAPCASTSSARRVHGRAARGLQCTAAVSALLVSGDWSTLTRVEARVGAEGSRENNMAAVATRCEDACRRPGTETARGASSIEFNCKLQVSHGIAITSPKRHAST